MVVSGCVGLGARDGGIAIDTGGPDNDNGVVLVWGGVARCGGGGAADWAGEYVVAIPPYPKTLYIHCVPIERCVWAAPP